MNEVAPSGSWCLWEHLGAGAAPAAPGQNLLVRRSGERDPEFGEDTFKRLAEGPEGRYLTRRSTLGPDAQAQALARFVAILDEGDEKPYDPVLPSNAHRPRRIRDA